MAKRSDSDVEAERDRLQASNDELFKNIRDLTFELEQYKAQGKPIWESRTVWTIAIGGVLSVLTIFGVTIPDELMQNKEAIAGGVTTVVLTVAMVYRALAKGSRLSLRKKE